MTETRITDDGVSLAHSKGEEAQAPERKTYKVTAENGLFKNGQQYNMGDKIELDEKTAQNFMEIGEVE